MYAVETVRMLLDQGRLSESGGRFRLDSDLGSARGARFAAVAHRCPAGHPRRAVPTARRGRVGPGAELQRSRPSRRVGGLPQDGGPGHPRRPRRRARSCVLDGRRHCPRSAVSTASSRACSGRSPMAACRAVTGSRCTWPRPRIFERAGSDELAGIVASHYLSALRSAPGRRRPAALVRARSPRSRRPRPGPGAIGAHASAAGYLADAVDARRRTRRRASASSRHGPAPVRGRPVSSTRRPIAREVVDAGARPRRAGSRRARRHASWRERGHRQLAARPMPWPRRRRSGDVWGPASTAIRTPSG